MSSAFAADRSLEATRAIADKRELQGRVEELEKDFEMEQQGTFDITQDMTRQYKGMQEELLNRVNTLENTITELRDQLGIFFAYVTRVCRSCLSAPFRKLAEEAGEHNRREG